MNINYTRSSSIIINGKQIRSRQGIMDQKTQKELEIRWLPKDPIPPNSNNMPQTHHPPTIDKLAVQSSTVALYP